MWIPKTEAEIIQAIDNKAIEESSIFDAKKELGTSNKEIAKDMAAMANNGGVIIYGIGEDSNGYPTIPNPIPLAGEPERIALIAQTAIVEPLKVVPFSIPSANDSSLGYLVVVIPPSERAPHMVEAKNDNRYYGRSGKTNIPLTEGEVARLYERRQKQEVDREALLDEEIKRKGISSEPDTIHLYAIVRPLFHDQGLLGRIAKSNQEMTHILNDMVDSSRVPNGPHRSSNDFSVSSSWKQQVEGLSAELGPNDSFKLEVDFDGTIHLFLGEGAYINSDAKIFRARPVAMYIASLLRFSSKVYSKTQYIGMVDICIALNGLKDSTIFPTQLGKTILYERNDYRKTTRISALSIERDYLDTAKLVFTPLMNAMTQGQFNPFSD